MPLQGSLSIERMCQLAGVSRAGFYRSLQERAPVEEDMEVRNVIQQIAVEHRRRYGYRRISAELRRRGMLVNHKRVLRIIREDNLLAVQPRAFVVTADSDHEFEVYLNLASRMKLTGMNQLWVADITYIRLKKIENAKSLNCKCANSKLSQQRGSPQRCVPICALLFPTRSYHCHRTAERLKGEADSEVKERTRVPNE